MSEEKTMNRWIVVVGAILIQLALGALYTWGTVGGYLSAKLHLLNPADATFTGKSTDIQLIYSIALAVFAFTMISAGPIMKKIGAKYTAMLGGGIVGISLIVSGFMTSYIALIFTYGVGYGIGIGIAYITPIATANKWFPDKKGLINGLAVMGFGLGGSIFATIMEAIGNPTGAKLTDGLEVFTAAVAGNVQTLFLVLGIVIIVMVFSGALTLKNPPEGWKPQGWEAPVAIAGVSSGLQLTRKETIKTSSFWILWTMYTMSLIAGMMVMGVYKTYATSSDGVISLMTVDTLLLLAILMAFSNGAGRLTWGPVADKINWKNSMRIMFLIQAIMMFLFITTSINPTYYMTVAIITTFCYGGNLTLFPTATSDLFGSDNLSMNYGGVFTAYGVAGLLVSGLKIVTAGNYLLIFVSMGIMSCVAIALTFILKPPTKA